MFGVLVLGVILVIFGLFWTVALALWPREEQPPPETEEERFEQLERFESEYPKRRWLS